MITKALANCTIVVVYASLVMQMLTSLFKQAPQKPVSPVAFRHAPHVKVLPFVANAMKLNLTISMETPAPTVIHQVTLPLKMEIVNTATILKTNSWTNETVMLAVLKDALTVRI